MEKWPSWMIFSRVTDVCVIHFYNGKLFGLRAGERRLPRLCNIFVKENNIIFVES